LCLFIAELIAKKYKFVLEVAKFVLVGGFADIVDIKLFLIIFIFLPFASFVKALTFLVAVTIKYIGNKNWTFTKNENAVIRKELSSFLYITAIGLFINVGVFYCATLLAPKTQLWTEISIIIAVLATAIFNFLGYKLIVFKKHGSII
jgi:putative flippase GtrA